MYFSFVLIISDFKTLLKLNLNILSALENVLKKRKNVRRIISSCVTGLCIVSRARVDKIKIAGHSSQLLVKFLFGYHLRYRVSEFSL